jgi:multiple sugar transport system substrate-binding protein
MHGSAAAGAGLALANAPGRSVFAQDASPAASAVASPVAFSSTIAERASGEVRFNAPASPAEQELINQQLANLATRYPNIQVSFEPVAAEYLTKIQTDIAAGNAADIFMVQNEYAQDFMSRDVLLPIDDYLTEDGVSPDEFYTPLITAYTWQDQLYGLPKD